MLSGANLQSNFQQQQTMVQYLQQQQYLQQNFPHQQLSMPGQQPPGFSSPVPVQMQQPPQIQMQAQISPQMQPQQYQAPQQVQQQPVVSYAPPPQQQQSHSQMMDSINTLAASIMQPQSYNTAQPPAHPVHRPAPVHYGAPSYPVPSAQVYETTNDADFLRQSVPPSPVTVPMAPPSPAPAPVPVPAPTPVYVREPTPVQAPPTPATAQIVVEEPPAVQESSRRSGSPKERSHRKEKRNRDRSKEREKDREKDRDQERDSNRVRDVPSVSKSGSDDGKHHGHDPTVMLTGRSAMDNSFNYGSQTGRLGTGQTGTVTPGSSNQNGAQMPANRIMRKGQQSNASSFAESNDLAAATILASGMAGAHAQNGHSQHAFMANLLNKQAQHGKMSVLSVGWFSLFFFNADVLSPTLFLHLQVRRAR